MGYSHAMNMRFLLAPVGMIFIFASAFRLRADEVNMQNGDRYFGKVLSVSADTVVLESEILGVINVPRKKVASLAVGNGASAPKTATDAAPASASANLLATAPSAIPADTNLDLSASFRGLGANTNFIGQIRRQLLAGNPGAASNYDEMVSGLLNGTLNVDDLRREAQSAAEQLRELKRDLGPQAGSSFDSYLEVLDNFLNETATGPTNAVPAPPPKPQAP
jgi:hypothetical protein